MGACALDKVGPQPLPEASTELEVPSLSSQDRRSPQIWVWTPNKQTNPIFPFIGFCLLPHTKCFHGSLWVHLRLMGLGCQRRVPLVLETRQIWLLFPYCPLASSELTRLSVDSAPQRVAINRTGLPAHSLKLDYGPNSAVQTEVKQLCSGVKAWVQLCFPGPCPAQTGAT